MRFAFSCNQPRRLLLRNARLRQIGLLYHSSLTISTKCYSNHITTRTNIQTAGLAFGGTGLCSYRVRGVDGSCAKHLTVESYMVIYAANSYRPHLLLLVLYHPLSLSFQT